MKKTARTIIDYMEEYGSMDLDALAFNEVDSLILCQLSYLKYDSHLHALSEKKHGTPLHVLAGSDGIDTLFEDKRYEKNNRALFFAAAESKRFGGMKLNNYVSVLDESWEVQFCALTYLFPNGLQYVAYRGTDETLVGWKEDFNMALFSPVPAQEMALKYLNRYAAGVHGNFFLGGHSKGGNLAVYAASHCNDSVRERIELVYNHDGPGFPPGTVMETEGFQKVCKRIRKYMPHSSIVGMLMESHEPYRIVECKRFGILQHDPYNWIVDGTAFRRVSNIYEHVAVRNESVNRWIADMSDEERHVFVNTLYNVMTASGAKTLIDIMSDFKSNSKAMTAAIDTEDEKTREMLHDILTLLFNCLQETMQLKVAERIQPGWKKLKEEIEKWS